MTQDLQTEVDLVRQVIDRTLPELEEIVHDRKASDTLKCQAAGTIKGLLQLKIQNMELGLEIHNDRPEA